MAKAGDLLKLFLDKQSLKEAQSYSSFFRSWESIAGVDTAAHSRIQDIQKGTLLVEVDHPAWIQMIQLRYKEILRKVQTSFPELAIKKIHLKLSSSPPPPAVKKTEGPAKKKNPENSENPELKDALQRLKKSIDDKESRAKS